MQPVKNLTAENQFTEPLFVGPGERYRFQCTEETATLDGLLTVQWAMWDGQSTPPTVDDDRWTDIAEWSVGSNPTTQVSDSGNAWFRCGIKTGDYVSGAADVLQSTDRVSI